MSPNVTELTGNADVRRDGQRVSSDYLRYDRATSQADARGGVTVTTPGGAEFTSREAQLNIDAHAGFADAGTYKLADQQGRGDMARVDFIDRDRTRLSDVRHTTCPEGRDDWYLRARTLDFDTAKDVGVARNMTLDFLGLPVFYLPYLSFPISDARKSGFLLPEIGYGSGRGAVVGAPYYLNLHPQYDATLTPRLMTERGLQLQGELRYLGRDSNSMLQAEYLPSDDVTGENRAAGTFLHRKTFNPYWTAAVDLRGVSDKDYLSDFGDHLRVTSETHLPQNAEVFYRGSVWTFNARAADYQTVDRTIAQADRPYARLPQLLLLARPGAAPGDPQYRFDSELVHFEREASVTGQRASLAPAISLPVLRPFGFLTPELGLRHIAYSLRDTTDLTPSVSAPFASLDSGLFFERELNLGGRFFTQTLEPRLYYLYVPHREQDHLPNFDTSLPDFTFANLFRNNRFVGGDRIGDANQLTMALTTRLLDDQDGTERIRASIGRIQYFDDRKVNIPAGTVSDTSSDLAAEAMAWLPGNWHARATVHWAPELEQSARSTFYLQHQPAANKILNLGYRFIRNELEQSDISAAWPVGGRWSVRARSIYSLRDNKNVESYIGGEYNACCWVARVYLGQRLVQATGNIATSTEQRSQIHLELELAGFGKSPGGVDSPLRQGLFTFPAPPSKPAPSPL